MADSGLHTDRFDELCTGYVLNTLDPAENAEFESLLKLADERQLKFYIELKSTAGHLAFTVDRSEPKTSVKEQLMKVIHDDLSEIKSATVQSDESSGGFDRQTLAVAASFALLVITITLLFFSLNLNSQLQAQNDEMESQRQLITELSEELEAKNELLAILESREVDMVIMNGMEASPNGHGKIIWDPENQQALLQVSNLPAVPNGMEYQLWIIRDNQPVSAGLFAVNDPQTDSFFKIEHMDRGTDVSSEAFAVTLEPRGGMPHPTGDMYLMGNMEN